MKLASNLAGFARGFAARRPLHAQAPPGGNAMFQECHFTPSQFALRAFALLVALGVIGTLNGALRSEEAQRSTASAALQPDTKPCTNNFCIQCSPSDCGNCDDGNPCTDDSCGPGCCFPLDCIDACCVCIHAPIT